jgi:hypothetical protein
MKIFTGFSACLAMLISPVAFSYEPDVWLTDLIHGSTVYQIENSSIKFHMECNTGGNVGLDGRLLDHYIEVTVKKQDSEELLKGPFDFLIDGVQVSLPFAENGVFAVTSTTDGASEWNRFTGLLEKAKDIKIFYNNEPAGEIKTSGDVAAAMDGIGCLCTPVLFMPQ